MSWQGVGLGAIVGIVVFICLETLTFDGQRPLRTWRGRFVIAGIAAVGFIGCALIAAASR